MGILSDLRGETKFISKKRRLLLIRTYLPDWVLTILLFGLFYLLDKVQGFKRQFDVTDTSIQHTFAVHERVPPYALFLICALAPAVIILLVALIACRSIWDWHSGWLGLLLSLALTSTATNIIKICVGRPRPDMLDRCQPTGDFQNRGPPSYGLSNVEICSRTDLLNDGFRSFPSGHSSLSWCGMIYLTMYLAGKMHIYDKKGMSAKSWILLAPLSACTLISVSRTMDYRHHATDVIAGAILGWAIGAYCYRQYYPALDSPLSHRPYSPRVARNDTDDLEGGAKGHGLDDERSELATRHSHETRAPLSSSENGSKPRTTLQAEPMDGGADGGVPIVNGRAQE